MLYLSYLLIFGIPVAAFFFFVITWVNYMNVKRQENVSEEEFKSAKRWFRIASIIVGSLVAVIVGFIILLYTSIAFM